MTLKISWQKTVNCIYSSDVTPQTMLLSGLFLFPMNLYDASFNFILVVVRSK